MTLKISGTAPMGSVVTDLDGYTLYRFDQDTAKPPASNCQGTCTQKWLPALVDGPVVTQGIEQSLVGKVKRPDGTWQLTLAGWPLYRFTEDSAPGDFKGQGLGGKWFATAPNGTRAKAAGGTGNGTADSGATGNGGTGNGGTGNGADNSGAGGTSYDSGYGAGSGTSGGGY
jgi:predicted lipoprotein with Yx(FWY)xxD motif